MLRFWPNYTIPIRHNPMAPAHREPEHAQDNCAFGYRIPRSPTATYPAIAARIIARTAFLRKSARLLMALQERIETTLPHGLHRPLSRLVGSVAGVRLGPTFDSEPDQFLRNRAPSAVAIAFPIWSWIMPPVEVGFRGHRRLRPPGRLRLRLEGGSLWRFFQNSVNTQHAHAKIISGRFGQELFLRQRSSGATVECNIAIE